MSSRTLSKQGLTETYTEVEKLIVATAYRFAERYHYYGEWEELLARANLLYVEACYSYDPNKAAFSTWVVIKVFRGLQMHLRDLMHRNCHPKADGFDLEMLPQHEQGFDLVEFAHDLSQDARIMIALVFVSPQEIAGLLGVHPKSKSRKPFRSLTKIADFLLDMGWAGSRVFSAIHEVREALR